MMAREFADLHRELRSVAKDLLSGGEPDWTLITQAGWPGLEIAESLGGAEVSLAETTVVAEELGRAAARSSQLGVSLGIGALLALPQSAARDAVLSAAAEGAELPVAVLSTGDRTDIGFTLESSDGVARLTGAADFVPDVADATRLLVLALLVSDSDTGGTPVLVDIDPASPGLTITARPTLDETRRLAAVAADGVQPGQVWQFAGDPAAAAGRLIDRASVAIAADCLGLAEAMLDATVSYVGIRHQFGRPIGSFQAVKHACADMLVQIRVTRQLVDAAVDALVEGGDSTGAASAATSIAASMAKAYASEAAVAVAGKAMQLHGGIGYTWESGIHVYLKRATLNRSLFGSPTAHRRALAARFR
ncbi:MAG: acyl-CoA dehydrogenase family protein [Microbacteriaceae bacterium]